MNMDGDLTSRNMNNGEGSNKDNPRFRNLKVNNRDNLRCSSQNNSLRRKFSGNRDSLRIRNHNTHSLKKNLKEGMQSIESRMTRSFKMLPSIISVV